VRAGERQVAPTREGIRRDHTSRYEWVVRRLGDQARTIIDVACGVGYGAQLLAQAGHTVTGIDCDAGAVAYARQYYCHQRATFEVARAEDIAERPGRFDVAVFFEAIEHIADPVPTLRALRERCGTLFASVPNEEVLPWDGHLYHFRHYTPDQFTELLRDAGWTVESYLGQAGPDSEVEEGAHGRTVIAVCSPAPIYERVMTETTAAKPALPKSVPDTVAILGLGPSVDQYLDFAKRLGARARVADEVWGINALGDVLRCDRVFHMDDVRVQQARADAAPESNIAAMLGWLKTYDGPVYTSVAHPDYPSMQAYPLEAVINSCNGMVYFNSTAAYAVAYAIHIGVKRIVLFGIDFTYPDSHQAEKGRACVEFWLGFARARGIKVAAARASSLLDACAAAEDRVYGYDCVHVRVNETGGRTTVAFVERDVLPSAAEIEHRYDHSRHPNLLVEAVEEEVAA